MKPLSKKIVSIRFVTKTEEQPDLSYIGEYTDKPEPWVFVRKHKDYLANLEKRDENYELPIRSLDCRFFKPYAGGETPGTKDYQEIGLLDYKEMEAYERGEWCMLHAWAEAQVIIGETVQTIRSAGCGGIGNTDDETLKQIKEEELAALYAILGELDSNFTSDLLTDIPVKDVQR